MKCFGERKLTYTILGLALLTLAGICWVYNYAMLKRMEQLGLVLSSEKLVSQTTAIFFLGLDSYSLGLVLLYLVYYLLNRQLVEYQQSEADTTTVGTALQQSEALFRSLCESSPVGIFRIDAEGKCIYTNPRCQAICGFTFSEALGDGWRDFVHPEDLESLVVEWNEAAKAHQEFSAELRYRHRDGSIRYCRSRAAIIFSAEQEIVGHVGTVEDITESRAIEKMKNEFISVVSHELRTPLACIRGSLGLIAAGKLDTQPQRARQMIKIAASETERLVRLVNDILDLERLNSRKVVLVKVWCDVATIMTQSAEVVRPLAEDAKITLNVSPLSMQVFADTDRIIQTLVNLLSNAVKFSYPESTVWLTAELLSKTKLKPTTLQNLIFNTPQVLFQVKDTGRGIPSDKLDMIFGPFQQVDASDSRDKGGTGLGLSICRSIVEQHGGHIWAESVLGQGSSFYFTLPLAL
jgi:PAS domain S-box-containing protein